MLIWRDQIIDSDELRIPHYGITQRAFVLTPLLHLKPDLVLPGQSNTIFDYCKQVDPIPLWMGIMNITPDSFSDGGKWLDEGKISDHIDTLVKENIHIIDLGAESTRPNATEIESEKEWDRLESILGIINQKI